MATLSVTQAFSVVIDGVTYAGGSTSTPQTFTVGSVSEIVFDRTYSVASSTAAPNASSTVTELFNTTTDLATFDFMFILSTTAGLLQILVNEGDANENAITIELRADVPFMIFSDTAMHGTIATIDTWEVDHALDVINRVEFHQSTGAAAKVRCFAVGD